MSKTGSSPHPDTVKPILHKTLHEKSRKKGKSLFNPCSLLEKRVAKVVNRSLFIDNNVFNISNIPVEYQVAPT